jgi:hypothetical protein
MEFTYENAVKFFDDYFKAFNKNAGPLETVPNMQKYYTPDFEWWSYSKPSADRKPISREGLLMSMVHPGLHEELIPQEYIVDVKRMVVVVRFQIQFTDYPSGTVWPPKQASAHYHLVLDENKGLKIKALHYWIGAGLPAIDKTQNCQELWQQYKLKALEDLANNWMKAPHKTLDEVKAKP